MYCIDSDFAIAILKGDPKAAKKLDELEAAGEVYITSISIFEMTYTSRGMSKKRAKVLYNFLDSLRVLDLDGNCALKASEVGTKLSKKGKMIHPMDLLIGSICLHHRMPFVTKNTKHFNRIEGLKVIPW